VTVRRKIGRCSRRLVSDGKKTDEQELRWASKQKKDQTRLLSFPFYFKFFSGFYSTKTKTILN
jgi:hypothetical protein